MLVFHYVPVSVRWYEVQATMYPIVLNILPVQSALVGKILPELLVDVSRACFPRVLAIHSITESFNNSVTYATLSRTVRHMYT